MAPDTSIHVPNSGTSQLVSCASLSPRTDFSAAETKRHQSWILTKQSRRIITRNTLGILEYRERIKREVLNQFRKNRKRRGLLLFHWRLFSIRMTRLQEHHQHHMAKIKQSKDILLRLQRKGSIKKDFSSDTNLLNAALDLLGPGSELSPPKIGRNPGWIFDDSTLSSGDVLVEIWERLEKKIYGSTTETKNGTQTTAADTIDGKQKDVSSFFINRPKRKHRDENDSRKLKGERAKRIKMTNGEPAPKARPSSAAPGSVLAETPAATMALATNSIVKKDQKIPRNPQKRLHRERVADEWLADKLIAEKWLAADFDDMVYNDTRPMHKRLNHGRRCRTNPQGNKFSKDFSGATSGWPADRPPPLNKRYKGDLKADEEERRKRIAANKSLAGKSAESSGRRETVNDCLPQQPDNGRARTVGKRPEHKDENSGRAGPEMNGKPKETPQEFRKLADAKMNGYENASSGKNNTTLFVSGVPTSPKKGMTAFQKKFSGGRFR